jgi:hypothetical protein
MADHEAQMNAAMLTGFRDELVREAGVITPGVDDTPAIHYAIEQLSRDRDTGYSGHDSLDSDETMPVTRVVAGEDLGYYQATAVPVRRVRNSYQIPATALPLGSPPPLVHLQPERDNDDEPANFTLARFNMTKPLSPLHSDDDRRSFAERMQTPPHGHKDVSWTVDPIPPSKPTDPRRPGINPVVMGTDRTGPSRMKTAGGTPELQYRPQILWPINFIILITLSLLMMAALVFCAIYSSEHNGFVAYSGTMYSGQYFTFRILPQLLAACILVYAQAIITTMIRVIPFIRLSSMERADRERAIYMDLYPRYVLWPRITDRWQIWLPMVVTWALYLSLPLQSSLFTVVLVDGNWRWATVQGVAWTLVAMYLILVVAMGEAGIYWWTRMHHTGLRWDPRCLADIITMVSTTNVAEQYRGTELAGRRESIRFALKHRRVEKLGYWPGKDGFVYGLRSMETPTARGYGDMKEKGHPMGAEGKYIPPSDLEASAHATEVRYRFLPWCLRDITVIALVVTGTVLVIGLFVVSFLSATRISHGFLPLLSAAPGPGAFSAADFLYTFVPSLIGLMMYLVFLELDMHLRILQPWAALASQAPRGATASQSILADYAACLPLQTTYRAVRNGHYRLAVVSALSSLFILLPVLGGGIFMALTDVKTYEVRMFPSLPVFGIVLGLCVLYLGGLMALVPFRHMMRLPHGVGCLAEIMGFLMNEELREEGVFRDVRSKAELVGRLAAGGREGEARWCFGVGGGRGAGDVLGVRRVRMFTVRKSQIRRRDDS